MMAGGADLDPTMTVRIVAPISGRLIPLEEVPDPVFAQRMAGDGVAIEPAADPSGGPVTVVAPCDGQLAVLFPGGHAMAVVGPGGLEVIVHAGIDTVELQGAGFETLAKQGDLVRAGQPLVRFDPEALRRGGKRAISPVLVANVDIVAGMEVSKAAEVRAGRDVLLTVRLKEPWSG